MERISSRQTFFLKRILPVFWFGFLALFLALNLSRGAGGFPLPFVVAPLVMAAIGYFLMRKFVWGLADEVTDRGDALLVRRGAVEERVALANVMNVSFMPSNPPRITLRLRQPGRLGSEIAFAPRAPFSLNPFAKNPVFEDLVARVDQARSKSNR